MWKKMLLGGRKAKKKKTNTEISTIPAEKVSKDIALDKFGCLFILGGHVAEHSSQDVRVLHLKNN